MLFPASFKLVLMCCSCMHHILPWVASSSFVMHHFCCASCLVHVWCVYLVVCFFSIVPVPLRLWGFVRLRLVRLHPFVFLWTRSSSLRDFSQDDRYPGSHYYHCYASCFVLSLCCASYHLFLKPPKLPCQPLTFSPVLANHCLAMLPLLLSPSYSIVSCRWSWRFLYDGHDYVGISQYLLYY